MVNLWLGTAVRCSITGASSWSESCVSSVIGFLLKLIRPSPNLRGVSCSHPGYQLGPSSRPRTCPRSASMVARQSPLPGCTNSPCHTTRVPAFQHRTEPRRCVPLGGASTRRTEVRVAMPGSGLSDHRSKPDRRHVWRLVGAEDPASLARDRPSPHGAVPPRGAFSPQRPEGAGAAVVPQREHRCSKPRLPGRCR
jgi:hypothetical protein